MFLFQIPLWGISWSCQQAESISDTNTAPTAAEFPTDAHTDKKLCNSNSVDLVLGSLDFTVKLGPEIDISPVGKAGFTFNKSLTTGETSAAVDLSLFGTGFSAESTTPQGGTFGGSAPTALVVSFLGVQYNFSTREWGFNPVVTSSKGPKAGIQEIVGLQVGSQSTPPNFPYCEFSVKHLRRLFSGCPFGHRFQLESFSLRWGRGHLRPVSLINQSDQICHLTYS